MSDSLNSLIGIHAYVFSYIKTLGDLTGKTVLDIPSGDGRATKIFKEQGAKVISLDIFPRSEKSLPTHSIYPIDIGPALMALGMKLRKPNRTILPIRSRNRKFLKNNSWD